ncbi:hypothetical protein BBJ28_00016735 [Nothophytophthora sp. Chile5]|nr:hypothetical protein BBJ28_00016735 [Nothophytophthora sp. Chile5]
MSSMAMLTNEAKVATKKIKTVSSTQERKGVTSETPTSKPENPKVTLMAMKASKYEERRWNAEALRAESVVSSGGVGQLLEKGMRKRNVRWVKVPLATARERGSRKEGGVYNAESDSKPCNRYAGTWQS